MKNYLINVEFSWNDPIEVTANSAKEAKALAIEIIRNDNNESEWKAKIQGSWEEGENE